MIFIAVLCLVDVMIFYNSIWIRISDTCMLDKCALIHRPVGIVILLWFDQFRITVSSTYFLNMYGKLKSYLYVELYKEFSELKSAWTFFQVICTFAQNLMRFPIFILVPIQKRPIYGILMDHLR